jgi:leucyl-tRNA synthetase
VPIPYDQLPLELPMLDDFSPTDDGSSCLARAVDWLHTTCPKCGGPAIREADTMPNWAGSSWYFLRYADAHNDKEFASRAALDYWTPIDWYNGGMEHTTLHLLYSRFWHKFLFDLGLVPTSEPYRKRTSHGMVLGSNGEKMSKSRGNVVNPDDYIPVFGADSFRTYIMFMGAFDQPIPWNEQGTRGCRRFLDRVWALQDMVSGTGDTDAGMKKKVHAAIKKVGEDYERMKFNTAIAAMMALTNDFYAKGTLTKDELHTLVLLLAPVAPHIAEEISQALGFPAVHNAPWPVYDESALVEDEVEYGVQVNGKVRGRITLPSSLDVKEVEAAALDCEEVKPHLQGKTVRKVIVVKNIVNIVAG